MSRTYLMTVAALLCGLTTANAPVLRLPTSAPRDARSQLTAHGSALRSPGVFAHTSVRRPSGVGVAAHPADDRRARTDAGSARERTGGWRHGDHPSVPCETYISIVQAPPDTTTDATVAVSVEYGEVPTETICASGEGFDPSSFRFTVNGVDRTSYFTVTATSATAAALPLIVGTVDTLRATTPGYGASGTRTDSATRVVVVPTYGLVVSSDSGIIPLEQTANTEHPVRVWNTSTVAVTYDLTCTWTGSANCQNGISPRTLVLGAGRDTTLPLPIYAANMPGMAHLTVRVVGRRGPDASTMAHVNVFRRGITLASMVGNRVVRSACPTIGAGPGSAVQCGDLLVAHSLPGYRSLNEARGITLLYNSQAASPRPVIAVDYISYANEPAAAMYRVTVSRARDSLVLAQLHYDTTSNAAARLSHRFVVPIDVAALGLGTGALPVRVLVAAQESGGWVEKGELATQLITVDRRASPFGAGWWPAGIERLHPDAITGNALVVLGDGSAVNYRATAGGGFESPAGEYATLTRSADGGYLRTLADRRTFVWYGAAGLVDSIGDNNPTRNVARYSWSAATLDGARLDSIRDPIGRATHFLYDDATGRVRAIKSYAIDTVRLATSVHPGAAHADLDAIADPDSLETPFFYDGATHRLTGYQPRAHGLFRFHYSSLGTIDSLIGGGDLTRRSVRAWQTIGAPMGTMTGSAAAPARRGSPDSVTTRVDIFIKTDTAPSRRQIWGHDVSFGVDRFGAVTMVSPVAGLRRYITRDSLGQPVQIVTNTGSETGIDWVDGLPMRERVRVDEVGQYPRYDTTSYAYHPVWRSPTSVRRPMGDSTTAQYDASGRRTGVTDAAGYLTTFTYTPRGQVATITEPDAAGTGRDPLPTVYSYDPLSLNLARVERGRTHTSYRYDSTYQSDVVRVEDALGGYSAYSYDRIKRPRTVTQCCGADPYRTVTVETRYDDVQRVRTQVGPSVDANGALATPEATTMTDAMGRVTLACTAAGNCERTFYNERGLVDGVQQRNGYYTMHMYDAVGLLRERLVGYDPMRMQAADTVRYDYDPAGAPVAIDNRYSRIRRGRDAAGRLVHESQAIRELADTATRYHQIEAVHRYDRNGRRVATLIDDVLRDSLVTCQKVLADEVVPICGVLKVGRDSVRYRYTSRDLLASISNTYVAYDVNRPPGVWAYTWNAKQQLTEVGAPPGVTQRYTYDADGWLRTYVADPVTQPETMTYDAMGRVTRWASWRTDDYRFDGMGRLVKTTSTHLSVPNDTMVYDPGGNRLDDGTWQYVYNSYGQLVSKARGSAACRISYSYDQMGNQRVSAWETPECDDRETPRTLTYDASGRMASSITYPLENQRRVVEPRSFWYDGLGRRILLRSERSGAADNGLWRYWWLDDHVVVKTRNAAIGEAEANLDWPRLQRGPASGAKLRGTGEWFFYGPGTDKVLASWNFFGQDTTVHYFVPDYRGNIVQVVDGARREQGRAAQAYTPFGTPGGANAAAAEGNPGYNGQEASGGLVYMRNRWYDPNTGRFTQVDPIGFAGGMNLYAYAGNDPVTYSDPYGLAPESSTDDVGDCRKVKCPPPDKIIRDENVDRAAKELRQLTKQSGVEHGAWLFNGPKGTVRVGPVMVGTATQMPQMRRAPDDAIGSIHSHKDRSGPSGNDVGHARANNINVVVTNNAGTVFILDQQGNAKYRTGPTP